MGGLRKEIPRTYWMMVIGTLALTGFPFTAGFYSKDAIIESAFAAGGESAAYETLHGIATYGFIMTAVAAVLTAFYSWRLIFMTFHGRSRARSEVMSHVHESPPSMLVPLYVLAAGALLAGILFSNLFIGDGEAEFWKDALYTVEGNEVLDGAHHAPSWVKLLPPTAMLVGFLVAYLFYIVRPEAPKRLARDQPLIHRFLLNKWYFDELFNWLLVRPAFRFGRFLWRQGDGKVIDGFGPDGVAARVLDLTNRVVRLQTGYLYHYAFAMLIGIALLITFMMFAN